MNELLKFEGRLALKKKEARELELRIRGLIKAVRDLLDPFTEDLETLLADEAAAQAMALAELHIRFKETRAKILALEKALGRAE